MAIMSGLSFLYLIPMVAVAFLFKFCMPSRICAIAQVLMAILWLVIKDDNIYNITAQSIICFLAILLTFKIKI